MIIGISGKIGSGKDTICSIIQYLTNSRISTNPNIDDKDDDECIFSYQSFKDFDKEQKKGGDFWTNTWKRKKFADKLKDIVCLLIGCTRKQLENADFKNKELGEEWWYHKVQSETRYGNELIPYSKSNLNLTVIKLTPRKLLQVIGTDLFRNQLHPNVHINALFNNYSTSKLFACDNCMQNFYPHEFEDNKYDEEIEEYPCPRCGKLKEGNLTMIINDSPSNWIVTDVRFPNEAAIIKNKGGILIRVERDLSCQICKLTKGERRGLICKEITCPNGRYKHESETALDNYDDFDYTIYNNSTINELLLQIKDILIKEKII